ncbi:MAG: hypothetical protein BWK77_09205 [Verrucomicrobia bacterium A1]|nr:MAG: hypothetical protein BWK77_09205 [Verrucomicrobia bacterium A1]
MTAPASARDATTGFWAAVIFLVSLAVFGLYYNRGLILADEGSLIHATQRIVHGEVPYRDFYHFYAPGSFYILAGLFKVLGERLLVSRMMWVVVRALSVMLVFLAASRLMPRRFAVWPAMVVLFIPGPWFKACYGFSALLSFWALLRYVERPTFARVAAHAGAAFAVIALSLLPVLVYFQRRNALGPMSHQLFGLAPSYTLATWHATVRKLPRLRHDLAQLLMFCIPPVVLATSGAWSAARARAKPSRCSCCRRWPR